jgi:hypothetical protein
MDVGRVVGHVKRRLRVAHFRTEVWCRSEQPNRLRFSTAPGTRGASGGPIPQGRATPGATAPLWVTAFFRSRGRGPSTTGSAQGRASTASSSGRRSTRLTAGPSTAAGRERCRSDTTSSMPSDRAATSDRAGCDSQRRRAATPSRISDRPDFQCVLDPRSDHSEIEAGAGPLDRLEPVSCDLHSISGIAGGRAYPTDRNPACLSHP